MIKCLKNSAHICNEYLSIVSKWGYTWDCAFNTVGDKLSESMILVYRPVSKTKNYRQTYEV